MTVDDIGRDDVSCIRIRIAEEVGEAHSGKGIFITERTFIELDHDQNDDSMMGPWVVADDR